MLRRCLLALVIFFGLTLPAQAVLTLGVVPDNANQLRSESEVRQQATQLQQLLNEEIRLRVFRSEAELNDWLQRYRMVDLALVSKGVYAQQPAGSLILLRQYSATDLVVARPGLKTATLDRLRAAVAALPLNVPSLQPVAKIAPIGPRKPALPLMRPKNETLQPGHEILATPGQAPRVTAQPAWTTKPAKTRAKKSASQPKTASAKPALPKPAAAVASQKSAALSEKPDPTVIAPAAPAAQPTPAPALVLPPPRPVPSAPPAATPAAAPLESPTPATATEPDTPSAIPWLGILILITGFSYLYYRRRQEKRPIDWSAVNQKKPEKAAAPVPAKRAPAPARIRLEVDPVPRPMPTTRFSLPSASKPAEDVVAPTAAPIAIVPTIPLVDEPTSSLDSMAALLTDEAPELPVDIQSDHLPAVTLDQQPEIDLDIPPLELDLPLPEVLVANSVAVSPVPPETATDQRVTAPPLKRPKPTKSLTESPPLRGDISAVNLPRLLEAAAAQPGPCILHIRGQHDEKRLHFRNGHLADAVSVNRANRTKTGFLMNKVGYLLIRQGRITEEQRDQALRLCEERPKLRIGEALVELGALSREALLEALQTQVEGVIFSLFIFPAGRYEIVADDSEGQAASDLNINLQGLLNKAETQEPEWTRIRQAIPTLDAILDFPEGGRDKLDSARMTEHQKLVLSLINGHRPIRDICIAATMLDLEVYKFLFFMVNAKILIRV